jgi:large subunit ribosomal protein L3
MLDAIFATKLGMTQAWSTSGKRLAVTKCKADDNLIVGQQDAPVTDKSSRTWQKNRQTILEVGYGAKKQQNMKKPLRERVKKSGFSFGVKQIKGIRVNALEEESPLKIGDFVSVDQVLQPGDVVKVQGTSKGRGFAGAVKRHGFAGGPATHGQSDRERAVGSIGAGTDPGRVWKGKKMPGHFGDETKTVLGLVVLYVDPKTKEVWLSGPVPGANTSIVKIEKTGQKKNIKLDLVAAGLVDEKPVDEKPEEKADEKKQPEQESEKPTEKSAKEETKQQAAEEKQESKKKAEQKEAKQEKEESKAEKQAKKEDK